MRSYSVQCSVPDGTIGDFSRECCGGSAASGGLGPQFDVDRGLVEQGLDRRRLAKCSRSASCLATDLLSGFSSMARRRCSTASAVSARVERMTAIM